MERYGETIVTLQLVGAPVERDRLIKLAEVERLTSLRKSSLYALMKRGQFVPSVRLTSRCVAWSERRVLQWVQERLAANDSTLGDLLGDAK